MNMAYSDYMDQETDYQQTGEFRSGKEKFSHRRKKPILGRRSKSPAAFNGIHRRRNKRFTW